MLDINLFGAMLSQGLETKVKVANYKCLSNINNKKESCLIKVTKSTSPWVWVLLPSEGVF